MSVSVEVYEVDNDNEVRLDLKKILDGKYSWLADGCITTDASDAMKLPKCCLEFLDALKSSDSQLNQKRTDGLKERIKNLEKELADAKKELEEMESKKNGEKV